MKPRILVMDDDASIRRILQLMLTKLGYDVVTVPSGEEALACYELAIKDETPYAAVLLDLTVHKGMGGDEVLPKLKALNPDLYSIVASGSVSALATRNYRARGYTDALAKPFRIQDVKKCLEKLTAQPAC